MLYVVVIFIKETQIQKKVFQTCPGEMGHLCTEFYKKRNPDWEFHVMNDKEVENYVLEKKGEDFLKIWQNLELRVMKYDYWR